MKRVKEKREDVLTLIIIGVVISRPQETIGNTKRIWDGCRKYYQENNENNLKGFNRVCLHGRQKTLVGLIM